MGDHGVPPGWDAVREPPVFRFGACSNLGRQDVKGGTRGCVLGNHWPLGVGGQCETAMCRPAVVPRKCLTPRVALCLGLVVFRAHKNRQKQQRPG